MGRKKTTNVTQTGLGDTQFDTLTGNQAALGATMDTQGAAAEEARQTSEANQGTILTNQGTMQTGITNLQTGQEGINTGITGLGATQAEIVASQAAAVEAAKAREAAIISAVNSRPQVDLSGVTSGISNLQSTTDTGFSNMGERFTQVDDTLLNNELNAVGRYDDIMAGQEGLGGQVTGVAGQLTDAQAAIDANEANAVTRAATAQESRDILQEAVLSGQVGLQDLIDQYGQAGATYYENLAAGQSSLLEGQAGLQSGLTAFQDQYGQDFAAQSDFLGNMQNTITGGFDQVAQGQGALGDSLEPFREVPTNTMQQIDERVLQLADTIDAQPTFDYARIAKDITAGVEQGMTGVAGDFEVARGKWTGQLDTMRNILLSQGDTLDQAVRQDYTELTNAFDQTGRLIANTVDEQGVRTSRAIDQNGNLLIAKFDATGTRILENSLNINSMLGQLEARMEYRAGANYAMGNLSPTMNRRYGLMSPYTQTTRGA